MTISKFNKKYGEYLVVNGNGAELVKGKVLARRIAIANLKKKKKGHCPILRERDNEIVGDVLKVPEMGYVWYVKTKNGYKYYHLKANGQLGKEF